MILVSVPYYNNIKDIEEDIKKINITLTYDKSSNQLKYEYNLEKAKLIFFHLSDVIFSNINILSSIFSSRGRLEFIVSELPVAFLNVNCEFVWLNDFDFLLPQEIGKVDISGYNMKEDNLLKGMKEYIKSINKEKNYIKDDEEIEFYLFNSCLYLRDGVIKNFFGYNNSFPYSRVEEMNLLNYKNYKFYFLGYSCNYKIVSNKEYFDEAVECLSFDKESEKIVKNFSDLYLNRLNAIYLRNFKYYENFNDMFYLDNYVRKYFDTSMVNDVFFLFYDYFLNKTKLYSLTLCYDYFNILYNEKINKEEKKIEKIATILYLYNKKIQEGGLMENPIMMEFELSNCEFEEYKDKKVDSELRYIGKFFQGFRYFLTNVSFIEGKYQILSNSNPNYFEYKDTKLKCGGIPFTNTYPFNLNTGSMALKDDESEDRVIQIVPEENKTKETNNKRYNDYAYVYKNNGDKFKYIMTLLNTYTLSFSVPYSNKHKYFLFSLIYLDIIDSVGLSGFYFVYEYQIQKYRGSFIIRYNVFRVK